ncbi:PAAR domain-containing protein [Pseudomonas viridiflava]|uniref:PAAR domain-containing protein n=1 Tax=Pseudomonas viridiflava TaxID=33069 RepID=UPI000F055EB5|nr:PAAR domain-containing protein [Pseudomonas viridiflava]MEE5129825.1 PAAR domain-containing protein [Pseudomonas alliivorans]
MSGKPAARVTDPTACPLPGHGTNPIVAGSGDVFFDGLPAARQGDASACGGAMSGGLATTVLINGKPAATVDSVGTHGNKVTAGSGTVIIGNSHTPAPFVAPEAIVIPGVFNRIFAFHTADGQPVTNLNYRMVSDSGLEKAGCTSATGNTGCFSTGKQGEMVNIYVSAE